MTTKALIEMAVAKGIHIGSKKVGGRTVYYYSGAGEAIDQHTFSGSWAHFVAHIRAL